ncbi:MAG: hypothetical protein OXL37_17485 [Chloroflexota bacterium]|nr:hypothetical protein [Chloroflexota bacterium]MDE2960275.1 hypothetical protein [Chloroflexota bacterium]
MESPPAIVTYAWIVQGGINLIGISVILFILIKGKVYRLGKFLDEISSENAALQKTSDASRKSKPPYGKYRSQLSGSETGGHE